MKMHEFRLRFHRILFLVFNEQYSNISSDNGLAPTRRQTIICTNVDQFTDAYMRHLASMS